MPDCLEKAAQSFDKVLKNRYELTVGNSKRSITLLIPSVDSSEFTHISGLDHLSDVSILDVHNSSQKTAVYKKILSGKIVFNDISASKILYSPVYGSHNFKTGSEYTIFDRLISLADFEGLMDNLYKGKVYKWNVKNCQIRLPNGRNRKCTINADYLLTVPSNNSNETIYMFAFQTNKEKKKDDKICLNIFSVFPDGVDMTRGQGGMLTVMEEKKNGVSIFVHPSYQKDRHSKSAPQANNIQKITFENPTVKNVVIDSSGAALAAVNDNFFDKLRDGLKNLLGIVKTAFSKRDKQNEQEEDIQNSPQNEEPTNEELSGSEPEKEEKAIVPEAPQPEVKEKTYDFPVSKELAELFEVREKFADGVLSLDEYKQTFLKYLRTLHGERMWREVADMLSKQLTDCPEKLKQPITYEIYYINENIRRNFPSALPASQKFQSMAEIKEFARQKCIEYNNARRLSEQENPRDNDHSRDDTYSR